MHAFAEGVGTLPYGGKEARDCLPVNTVSNPRVVYSRPDESRGLYVVKSKKASRRLIYVSNQGPQSISVVDTSVVVR